MEVIAVYSDMCILASSLSAYFSMLINDIDNLCSNFLVKTCKLRAAVLVAEPSTGSMRCAGTSGTGPRRTRLATAAVPKRSRVSSSELRAELSIVV